MSDKTKKKRGEALEWSIVLPALGNSFRKLDPRLQWKNPVMFVVLVGGALTGVLFVHALFGHGEAPAGSSWGSRCGCGSR